MKESKLPVVVIGGGPVGLAAAAHLISKGETPLVLEGGQSVGASIMKWGHVRMFSPWKYNVDPVAVNFLKQSGWQEPDPEQLPLGRELVEEYLSPLAALPQIRDFVKVNSQVTAVTRYGFDKMKTEGRGDVPFLVLYESAEGEHSVLAKAVIDASGTYASPNPLGASGVVAQGEAAVQRNIFYGVPNVLGKDRTRFAGKSVMIVGAGHSAANVLLELTELAKQEPGTRITWVVRRKKRLFGGEQHDELAARGMLGSRVRQLVESGRVQLVKGFKLMSLSQTEAGIVAHGESEKLSPVDEIIACTGFRPNLSILTELRLNIDPVVESPFAIAPMIDPNVHSCGSVPPHGAEELKHADKDFYIVGMKSYGRAPTFLMLTGYEQVRSVVCAIAGDFEGARAVELQLPETGVCFTDVDEGDTGCCGITQPGSISAETANECCTNEAALVSPPATSGCCA